MPAELLSIAATDLRDPAAEVLILALNAELSAMYHEPGANHFTLDPAQVAEGAGVFLVAWRAGVAVGCGAVRRVEDAGLPPDTGEVKRMFVVPEARGTGVGRAIVTRLEAEARQLGLARLVLETGTRNHDALALYAKMGFSPIPLYGEYLNSPATSRCFGKDL